MNRLTLTRALCAFFFLTPSLVLATPDLSPNWIKNDTQTFNHIFEYAIRNQSIWYRERGKPDTLWQILEFDGKDGVYPVSIRADGANLMVLDSKDEIHYKKVFKEKRDSSDAYIYEDRNNDNKWLVNWFSFPVIRLPKIIFNPKRLKLPPDVRLWSISHRGEFVAYFEDIKGRKHPEFSMVTTVYIVSPDGETVIYADPFMIRGFNRKKSRISSPLLTDPLNPEFLTRFKIDSIDSAASTVIVSGVHFGRRRMFYQAIDYDLKRRNPMLPGFYDPEHTTYQDWLEIALPEQVATSTVKPSMSIEQTGMGNAAREIRIEGYNELGQHGLYVQASLGAPWFFRPL